MARGRWWLVGALGVVLAVLVVVLAVRLRDDGGDTRSGVFVIGDSITVMAGGQDLGPDGWQVDARSGRTTPEGIEVAAGQDLADRSVVIVALGTNDHTDDAATYGRKVDAMLRAIGPGPLVVWVNVDAHTPELADAARGVNVALAAAALRHPNLRVADWDTYVGGLGPVDGLRAGDGIHYGTKGSELRREWTVGLVAS
ncbi:hypothetical protein KSP35_01675 [Aquihabitans sp. G128]|uniref:hypothetical protein n=1 Tax=Aquihabitans sp. G128 TaxID=2849779 RepID=UPI001C230AEE|nr:hypothetical protein [Aquihabitans sp. G128]QXC61585.1 hypothetical protein KSP35_01675 [Aquihabitans sp. G128]